MPSPRVLPRLPLVLWFGAFFLIAQDTLNTKLGAQGPATMLIGASLLLSTIATTARTRSVDHLRAVPGAMWLFVGYAIVLLAVNPTVEGFQNVLLWAILPLAIANAAATRDREAGIHTYRIWLICATVAASIYLLQVAIDGPGADDRFYTNRGAGWLCLMAMVLVAPKVITTSARLWPLVLPFAAVVLSLSRTATAIALVLVAVVACLRPRRGSTPSRGLVVVRALSYTTVIGAVSILLVTQFEPLRVRFLEGDNAAVGGVALNTSGRAVLWGQTIDQWREHIWTGNGPGESQRFFTSYYNGVIAHPHNEYLRFLSDTGIIGLAIWFIGMVALAWRLIRALRLSAPAQRWQAIAGLVALLVVMAGSITDNMTISVSIIVIAGGTIGLALSPSVKPQPQTPNKGNPRVRGGRNARLEV